MPRHLRHRVAGWLAHDGSARISELPSWMGPRMGSAARNPRIVGFADCTLNLQTAELSRNGTTIILQAQPFQILAALLASPGQLVTREELVRKLWPKGTFVDFDQSLNKAVGRLREALGDKAEEPRFVETLPRKGYRWIGATDEAEQETKSEFPDQSSEAGFHRIDNCDAGDRIGGWKRRSYLLTFVLLTVLLGSLWFIRKRISSSALTAPPAIGSVAVLPLENLLGDQSKDYLVDGLTDSLITDLARHTTAQVISRTSAMHYKGTSETLPEIARDLKVDAIVEGSISQSDGQVRINLQLVRARTDTHIWTRTYEGELAHLSRLQDHLVQDLAAQLYSASSSQAERSIQFDSTAAVETSPESHNSYLYGMYYSNKLSRVGLQKGIAYFEHTISFDPNNKLAYAALAEAYLWMSDLSYLPANKGYPLAKSAALKALRLDERLAEGHNVLAWVAYTYEWDRDKAEHEFLRALSLNPNYAAGHAWYGMYLARVGRETESIRELETAKQLDPLSLMINAEMFMPLYFSREYDQAVEVAQGVLAMDPSFQRARDELIFLYELRGQLAKAVQETQKAATIQCEPSGEAAYHAHLLHKEFLRHGARGYWNIRLFDAMRHAGEATFDKNDMAFILLHVGDKKAAIEWLQRSFNDRSSEIDMDKDPEFDGLGSEPGFISLSSRMTPRE
jgi:TolB-like protein/DNA-binding winged helix-turn-helix (wHTH) protein